MRNNRWIYKVHQQEDADAGSASKCSCLSDSVLNTYAVSYLFYGLHRIVQSGVVSLIHTRKFKYWDIGVHACKTKHWLQLVGSGWHAMGRCLKTQYFTEMSRELPGETGIKQSRDWSLNLTKWRDSSNSFCFKVSCYNSAVTFKKQHVTKRAWPHSKMSHLYGHWHLHPISSSHITI